MLKNLEIYLIVRNEKNGKYTSVTLPVANKKELMKRLRNAGITKVSNYRIIQSDYLSSLTDEDFKDINIVKLNIQLKKINELGKTHNEIVAVKQAFKCETLDEIIDTIETIEYDFFDDMQVFMDEYAFRVLEDISDEKLLHILYEYCQKNKKQKYVLDKFKDSELLEILTLKDVLKNTIYAIRTDKGIIIDLCTIKDIE